MSSTDTFAITSIVRVDPRQIRISGDLILKGEVRETIKRNFLKRFLPPTY
jgi:hypothetical protein